MRWLKWNGVLLVLLLGLIPPLQGIAKGQESVPRSEKVTVREGEKIRVRVLQQLSSKTANVGDVFDGEVADEVEVGGKVAVAKGASVLGTITAVQRAAWLGRPGRLGFTFEYAKAVDATKVRLRSTAERVGQGNEALTWGLGLLLFLPLLLIKGKEMEVNPGTVFTAFVDRDAVVAVPLPTPAPPAAAPTPAPTTPAPTPEPTQAAPAPAPIPSPSPTPGALPVGISMSVSGLTVTFRISEAPDTPTHDTHLWNFGDRTSEAQPHSESHTIVHTYTAPGLYAVILELQMSGVTVARTRVNVKAD